MVDFRYVDDVRNFLKPLGYASFWDAMAPYGIFDAADRAHAERLLVKEAVPMASLMTCLKNIARLELEARYNLPERTPEPPARKRLLGLE